MAVIWTKISYLWRLVATASAFLLFGIAGIILPLVAAPVLLLVKKSKRQLWGRLLVSWAFKVFVLYMRMVGILRRQYTNTELLKEPGQLIIANHPTLLDVVFLVSLIPNACCIVKGPVFSNPVMRGIVIMAGYLVNTEGEKLLDGAKKALEEGANLVIFPEGTRTKVGREMSVQRGWAHIALRAQVCPTRVLIKCNPATLSKQHRWYHIPDRSFVMSIDVRDKMAIDDYASLNPALGARRMSSELKNYYMEVL